MDLISQCPTFCASISRAGKRFLASDLCFKNLAADVCSPASPTCQAQPPLMGRLILLPPGISPQLCQITQYQPFRVACATVESRWEVTVSTDACGTQWPLWLNATTRFSYDILLSAFSTTPCQVPQFYGKWPFLQFLGLQEPASSLASLLQFICSLLALKHLGVNLPSSAPLKPAWRLHMVAVAAPSLCSFLYHGRESQTTELLDSCTSLLPLLSSLALLAHRSLTSRQDNLVFLATTSLFLAFVLPVVLVRPEHHTLFQVSITLIT